MKIIIFGLAGTGKTTIAKMLAKEINYDFKSTGNMMREFAKELNLSIYDFENKLASKDYSFDIKLDNKVADFGKNNDNFIFESRLARYFIPDGFKIFLYCDDEERYKRIQKREKLSFDDIKAKTKKREDDVVKRYAKIYPDIEFPPKRSIFDLFIDTSNISPEEIVRIILNKIGNFT